MTAWYFKMMDKLKETELITENGCSHSVNVMITLGLD